MCDCVKVKDQICVTVLGESHQIRAAMVNPHTGVLLSTTGHTRASQRAFITSSNLISPL